MNELVQTAALIALIGYATTHTWLLHRISSRLARVEQHIHLRKIH